MEQAFILLFILLALISPLVLTGVNVYNLFSRTPFHETAADTLTMLFGPLFSAILWGIWSAKDWDDPILLGGDLVNFHTPLYSGSLPTVLTLAVFAILAFLVLSRRWEKLPPIPAVLCIAGTEVGVVLSAVTLVQLLAAPLAANYMLLFPLNYILCAARVLRRSIAHQVRRFGENPPQSPRPAVQLCCRVLHSSLGWYLLGFVAALPLLAVLLAVLTLFGQAPDAAVRAFTETSDWTLSQKISPPPVEWDGHYLCTVAVGGHRKLVKPTRYGIRHGKRIVVNRQLCVANAFEQLIHDRAPRFHRAVRDFYDTHGYPLSKKLTTPLRADVVYLLMKPLEWLFLLTLYTFDVTPETRIALQYTK